MQSNRDRASTFDLIGKRVGISLGETWEFVQEHGPGPFLARVLQVGLKQGEPNMEVLLVQLETPLNFEGVTCEYFIVATRYVDSYVSDLLSGTAITCNLTRIPEEMANSASPFDLRWWRGGLGLIGDVKLLKM